MEYITMTRKKHIIKEAKFCTAFVVNGNKLEIFGSVWLFGTIIKN
jgi:hypothetical protein